MSNGRFVIVGAGLAGAKAAQELREQGFDGELVLIGAEPDPPYERPPLSKDYLRGESARQQAFVHDDGFYDQHDIALITARNATKLDLHGRRVGLDDGREIGFDKLLLATGAEPRRLTVPGAELDGVHYLRTISDSERLRERLDHGGRVAVVGAGWIGSEVAASARQRGLDVTLIDPLPRPNERIFGPEIGSFYRDVHDHHGVELALGEGVEAFEGERHVTAVRTTSGRVIECDFAVAGIGVVPRVQLAAEAGLEIDNGIVVDEGLQTSVPGVFAAGDVASAWHPFYETHIRVEHWANALNQGPSAARSMLGEQVSYDRIPYFFSDQYEVGMEYSGWAPEWDEIVFRGARDQNAFVAFWLKDGGVVAGMNVNTWDVNEHVQALIRSRRQIDAQVLSDLDTPLETLVEAATTRP